MVEERSDPNDKNENAIDPAVSALCRHALRTRRDSYKGERRTLKGARGWKEGKATMADETKRIVAETAKAVEERRRT